MTKALIMAKEMEQPEQWRCARVVAALNDEMRWQLAAAEQQRYVDKLVTLKDLSPVSDTELRAIVTRYHSDHELVERLRDRQHPLHNESWQSWLNQVARFLQSNGFGRTSLMTTIDIEDLTQHACAEVAKALPSFQYGSRLSTWIFQVASRSVQRYLRDQRAKKRTVNQISLDLNPLLGQQSDESMLPESELDGRGLLELIVQRLSSLSDKRSREIFLLWAAHDQTTADIGKRVHLSPQRVRALVAEVRTLLQQDPELLAWLAACMDVFPSTTAPDTDDPSGVTPAA
jgi:RNA polymerase sigma factor (sigma-70 family)